MSRIVAHFKSMHDARETINELEKHGFHGAYLDAHDMFNTEFATEPLYGDMDITSAFSSNLYKSVKNLHGRAYKAINNCSLPVSTDTGEDNSHITTRLVINTDDNNNSEIKSIIKFSGGNIYS